LARPFSIPEWRGDRQNCVKVGEAGLPSRFERASIRPMSLTNFLRIERELGGDSRHYVVHTRDPKFSMELTPDRGAPDHVGRGVIKRVCVPNSWAGDYGQYAKLISAAQEFFARSFAEPVAKSFSRRHG